MESTATETPGTADPANPTKFKIGKKKKKNSERNSRAKKTNNKLRQTTKAKKNKRFKV